MFYLFGRVGVERMPAASGEASIGAPTMGFAAILTALPETGQPATMAACCYRRSRRWPGSCERTP